MLRSAPLECGLTVDQPEIFSRSLNHAATELRYKVRRTRNFLGISFRCRGAGINAFERRIMEEHSQPLHTKNSDNPPASVVLSLLVVLTVFASGVFVLAFYLK
jgi:hypothetical protein